MSLQEMILVGWQTAMRAVLFVAALGAASGKLAACAPTSDG
ncbi:MULTISPECIES: hypothetical protein [Methanoculleus]|nr:MULTISPECIES: hypothetical protein [Methanoculleus]HQD26372.1 hypothetical protein [Methanoculleus thermophilus]